MAKIREEEALHDGWTRWVYPLMDSYKMSCCDCGLVHDMQFRVTDSYDRVEFRVRRNNRSTAQVRRHMAVSKVLRNPERSKKAITRW